MKSTMLDLNLCVKFEWSEEYQLVALLVKIYNYTSQSNLKTNYYIPCMFTPGIFLVFAFMPW